MGLEGPKKRNPETARKKAQLALQSAILLYMAMNPDGSAAGKREAVRVAEGLKISRVEPDVQSADVPIADPKDPKIKFMIRKEG